MGKRCGKVEKSFTHFAYASPSIVKSNNQLASNGVSQSFCSNVMQMFDDAEDKEDCEL